MNFGGVNYFAIPIAAFASFLAGGIWYGALSKPWLDAAGMTPEKIREAHRGQVIPWAFVIAVIAQLLMALVLAGVMGHLGPGQVTLHNGLICGGLAWLGFVITTLSTNHAFQEQPAKLTLIDGLHWLLVLLIQGAVIGIIGV